LLNVYTGYSEEMLENTEGATKKGQSRETGNIGYTRPRKTKQKQKTICIGHHYTQTNSKNVNKTRAFLQTTGGKDEPNIVFYGEIITDITTQNSEHKNTKN